MSDIKEDIKILKHIALAYKDDESINNSLVNINTSTLITNRELAQAIENILNRLEQLEKENRKLSNIIEAINQTTPINMVTNTDYSINIDKDSIPKSVIRDKIEELENEYDKEYHENYYGAKQPNKMPMLRRVIDILKEILGDE